jgi:hypothetical protein
MRRSAGLVLALVFVAFFWVLTLLDLRNNGLDPVALIAILILLMFTIGLVGALLRPPGD